MKTPEEWCRDEGSIYDVDGKPSGYVEHHANEFITLVKQIQLDAWKQGMKDCQGYIDNSLDSLGVTERLERTLTFEDIKDKEFKKK